MFTGIIQNQARVVSRKGHRLSLALPGRGFRRGDSVAVNGACLTVTSIGRGRIADFDMSEETLSRTTLGKLEAGDRVNVERPLTPSQPLGGHFVTGHVDGVGRVERIRARRHSKEVWFRAPAALLREIAPKGSVSVEGVSLTVVEVSKTGFSVSLIPFSLRHTTLGARKPGDPVNLETDLLAKYVGRLNGARKRT